MFVGQQSSLASVALSIRLGMGQLIGIFATLLDCLEMILISVQIFHLKPPIFRGKFG